MTRFATRAALAIPVLLIAGGALLSLPQAEPFPHELPRLPRRYSRG